MGDFLILGGFFRGLWDCENFWLLVLLVSARFGGSICTITLPPPVSFGFEMPGVSSLYLSLDFLSLDFLVTLPIWLVICCNCSRVAF